MCRFLKTPGQIFPGLATSYNTNPMKLTGPHSGWQERTIQLFGEEKFARLQDANVLVTGMGGVGSMAAEMICRSGVGLEGQFRRHD
jgi:hypothetical protein